MITRIVRNFGTFEACFYVETTSKLTDEELKKLHWQIAETFQPMMTYGYPSYQDGAYVEIGPRLSVETPESTNAVAICRAMGVNKVTRIEQSRIFQLSGVSQEAIFAKHLDKMTQVVYPFGGINNFASGVIPEAVRTIPVIGIGEENIRRINKELGLGMDDWAINYVTASTAAMAIGKLNK
jgi:phosphoribosylformylglycinamidine synthase